MDQIKQELEEDMRSWFADIQASRKVPSGIPQKAEIKTEVFRLTPEQFAKFQENPQQFLIEQSTVNSNASADPLFS